MSSKSKHRPRWLCVFAACQEAYMVFFTIIFMAIGVLNIDVAFPFGGALVKAYATLTPVLLITGVVLINYGETRRGGGDVIFALVAFISCLWLLPYIFRATIQ